MIKLSSKISIAILSLVLLMGCSLFKSQPKGTIFTFDYEGKTYEIVGYNEQDGESANFLIHRQNDAAIFRAIDQNQTGVLNKVITGSISLEEANSIYHAGIEIAREEEQFREKERERLFETEIEEFRAIVESYLGNGKPPQNRVLIYDLNRRLLGIYWDDNSNGIVDRMEYGELEIEAAQTLYETALERAKTQEKLDNTEPGKFIISKISSDDKDVSPISERE